MPDSYAFDNLPEQGRVIHRCIECGWPGWGRAIPEADRRRHHDQHVRERRKAAEKASKANLAKARKAKRTYQREGHE